MARLKRKSKRWIKRLMLGLAAIPALYLLAALLGSLIAVNRGWQVPDQGVSFYLADNGLHADLFLPAAASAAASPR
jgi:hypothetical protein